MNERIYEKQGDTLLKPKEEIIRCKDCRHVNLKDFMRIDMAALECCEQIYMLDNWEDSPGAKRELEYAKKLGLDIMWESEEVEKRKQRR